MAETAVIICQVTDSFVGRAYAKKRKIPIKTTKEKVYSIDKNIWGVSIEGGVLEDVAKAIPKNSYYFVKPLSKADKKETVVKIEFKKGVPVKLNGKPIDFVSMIERLNKLGAKAGVGRTDLIEDRVVGIKSREIYEAPAAWILHIAHKELENLTLDRETLFFKEIVSQRYAQLVYQGLWFCKLREAMDSFVQNTQKVVSGTITLSLYKGNIVVAKRFSPNSLYKKNLATYGEGDKFDRKLAEGFIKIWQMPYLK